VAGLEPPSPEVRAYLKAWCDQQRKLYGPDWKKILSAKMAAQTAPVLEALLSLTRRPK
jgi:hypothetical protein